jgi:DNA replication protein DnaC
MMMNNTLTQLRELKLAGMASAVEEQLCSAASTALSFEERLALMVDREVHHRDDKRRAALLKKAGLKYPQACIEDVDSKPGRGFERSSLMSLALSRWVEDGAAILICGATGSGKSWIACALAQYACTCECRAWPRTSACCMATGASDVGSQPLRVPMWCCWTIGDWPPWTVQHALI